MRLERVPKKMLTNVPIASMYDIFTYIYQKNQPNVGKYTIHGWYGVGSVGLGDDLSIFCMI